MGTLKLEMKTVVCMVEALTNRNWREQSCENGMSQQSLGYAWNNTNVGRFGFTLSVQKLHHTTLWEVVWCCNNYVQTSIAMAAISFIT